MLQIEKQKEELAKQKSVLEMKTMQIQAERDREKRDEEHIKAIEKGNEANAKHIEQANEERKKMRRI